MVGFPLNYLKAKTYTEDEGGHGGDEAGEECVEGEGANLRKNDDDHGNDGDGDDGQEGDCANQTAVEELEHPREEDVGQVGVDDLQLPANNRY